MTSLFDEMVREVIRIEGGYVNRPDDSGGPTKNGITQDVARRHGYVGDMKDLPLQLTITIYKLDYWDMLKLDDVEKLSPAIAHELFDTGVNQGVGRAAEFMQRLLNVLNVKQSLYKDLKVDGRIGPASIAAFKAFLKARPKGETVFLRGLNCLQGEYYITLAERREKDEAFIYGWLDNRIA